MFKHVMMAAAVLLSLCAQAQRYAVYGTVRDSKNQESVVGATLQLSELSFYTTTDAAGRFRFDRVPTGEYTVTLRSLGYTSRTEKISVAADQELTLSLDPSYTLTDEVVVLSTRADRKTPTTFTNVSKDELARQNFGQDLPLLLNWTPSLVTTSNAGAGVGYTGLRIRGSDATRINVTINGIPYNDSESQGTFWVDIPDVASSTQSIQVQRGVGTSTNGAGSFGGTVNLQTLSLQPDPYAEVMVAAGSFNTQRYTAKAGTGLINNHWAFDAKVSKILSDGYIDRAESDLSSYYISGGYYGKKTVIKAITFGGHERTYQAWNGIDAETMKTNRTFNSCGALYDENWNVIGYYNDQVDEYRQDHYQLHLTQQLNDAWNVNASLHYTYGRGYYEQYQQGTSFADLGLSDIVLGDTTLTYGDFVTRKWLNNKFYGGTFSLNYDQGKTSFILGGAFNQYGDARHYGKILWGQYMGNVPTGYKYYDGDAEKNDFNIYAKWNYDVLENLNVFVDLQYRTVDYKTSGLEDGMFSYDIQDSFHFFNPKAGISYTVSERDVLYSSYAIANREPNRTDYLGGTEKPKHERLGNLEMGWRRQAPRYSLEANYYLMNYTDQLVLTGRLDNVGNPIRANVGKSYRTGIELSGGIKLTERLAWQANATWSVNRNQDYVVDPNNVTEKKTTAIILSPGWIAGSQLTWNAFRNFQATWLAKYVGKQYLDNTESETLTLDSYFTNDVRFNYRLPLHQVKRCEVSLLVNNVFDVEYSSDGYAYDGVAYYFPQAGTNFMAMLTVGF
ncbi:TonB-dependent receptor [Fulvivirgaceae bacterium PWU5]|uniref:TonB-dependent receptor n=1 Tax=Dawidia cretensis TaxID=2782350 RepID=A0AAP2DVF4_9BACT|nr:TonB-dependent receptor [Dawidia cretensis]MBT1706682.1 TonB-dependent receptor [Dawidia cretensis]